MAIIRNLFRNKPMLSINLHTTAVMFMLSSLPDKGFQKDVPRYIDFLTEHGQNAFLNALLFGEPRTIPG